MTRIKAGIVGAAGYAGCELIRLLEMHPHAEVAWLMTGKTHAGKTVGEVFPHLGVLQDRTFLSMDTAEVEGVDVVFLAVPHGVAVSIVPEFLERGCRVIDLSADYRLKDASTYEAWYGKRHTAPELLAEAVYGLTELYRAELGGARLVANPGCYPTVSILALAPLLKEGLAAPDGIVIDAKSGISGAGRTPSLRTHYAEGNEDFQAYNPARHRHIPEIEQELARLAGRPVSTCFVPHLVPMTRGMLATVYCRPAARVEAGELTALYRDFYRDEPFVRVLEGEALPRTKDVWGGNLCEVAVRQDPRSGTILVVAVIDNLVKGASGQAVQNMNVVYGLPETSGLDWIPLYP